MTFTEFSWETRDKVKLYAYQYEPSQETKGIVCLVHGLGEHSNRYVHVAKSMNEAGYSFAAFDQRGHGKSQGLRGHTPSLETSLEDIDSFIERLNGDATDGPIFLYGHSLGGMLVLSYLTHYSAQLSGVISTGPILRPGFDPPPWKLFLGKVMRSLIPTFSMANGLDRTGLSRDTEIVHAYNTDPFVHDRVSAQLGIDMLEEGLWLLENSSEIKIPTLIMQGSQDRICSPQASRDYANKNGELITLKIWDGLYHEIHNEPEKDQVLQFLIQWMDGLV